MNCGMATGNGAPVGLVMVPYTAIKSAPSEGSLHLAAAEPRLLYKGSVYSSNSSCRAHLHHFETSLHETNLPRCALIYKLLAACRASLPPQHFRPRTHFRQQHFCNSQATPEQMPVPRTGLSLPLLHRSPRTSQISDVRDALSAISGGHPADSGGRTASCPQENLPATRMGCSPMTAAP